MSVFKAYDIRGTVPGPDRREPWRGKIGAGFAQFLGAKRLVVGRDMRTSSPSVHAAVIEGITDAGLRRDRHRARVDADGLLRDRPDPVRRRPHRDRVPQPEAVQRASSSAARARGRSRATRASRRSSASRTPPPAAAPRARGGEAAVGEGRLRPPHRLLRARPEAARGSRWTTRTAWARHEGPDIFARAAASRSPPLYDRLDGTFPNHEANPLKEENLDDLRARVRSTGADLGVSFDGDADRCAFVDHEGRTVSADLVTAHPRARPPRAEPGQGHHLRPALLARRGGGDPRGSAARRSASASATRS